MATVQNKLDEINLLYVKINERGPAKNVTKTLTIVRNQLCQK